MAKLDMEVAVAESITPAIGKDKPKTEVTRYFLRSKRKAVDPEDISIKKIRVNKKAKCKEIDTENKSDEFTEEKQEKWQPKDDIICIEQIETFHCNNEKSSQEKITETKENNGLNDAEKKNKFAQSLLMEQSRTNGEKLTLFQKLKRLFGTLKSKENHSGDFTRGDEYQE